NISGNDAAKENYATGGGGGIYCDALWNQMVTIENNEIFLNSTWSDDCDGGGIHCHSPVCINNNTIADNTVMGRHGRGGGIYSWGTITLKGNIITGNKTMDSYSHGGGIFNEDSSSSGIIADSIISNNILSGPFSSGGGIYCYESDIRILNNIIYENTADHSGGGIFSGSEFYGNFPLIANCTIISNIVTPTFGHGGGIISLNSAPAVSNSILWNNQAELGKEISIICSGAYSSELTISYSDVEGGLDSVFEGTSCILHWGAGMIDANPLFVYDAVGDYHLTYPSPCKDTGDNTAVIDPIDFEGDPRIAWRGTVDMGADEFYTHMYCAGDFTPSGAIEGKLVGLPGTSPVSLFFGSGVLDPPMPTAWGNFHLHAPWFMFPMAPIPTNGVLVLPATIPATPPAPYDLPMQALIGLDPDSLSNLYVLEVR
ncbi:MAG: right-handed parallel beta-helix repeat-containing protein, partial [Planctomycetota bacterium]